MSDLQSIMTAIDQLEPADLLKLWQYIEQKTKAIVDPPEQLAAIDGGQEDAAHMTDTEIDLAISDVALDVERGRPTKSD